MRATMLALISLLLIASLAYSQLETPTNGEEKHQAYVDKDADGINDNLVGSLEGTEDSPAKIQSDLTEGDNGGRQEARDRYKHGYHGQELERNRLKHNHK